MSVDINDPRITAYALGEMNDAERADFERLIDGDDDVLAEVGEIAALASLLSEELDDADAPTLTEAERQSVFEAIAAEEEEAAAPPQPGSIFAAIAAEEDEAQASAEPPPEPEGEGAEVVRLSWWKVGLALSAAAAVLLVFSFMTVRGADDAPVVASNAESGSNEVDGRFADEPGSPSTPDDGWVRTEAAQDESAGGYRQPATKEPRGPVLNDPAPATFDLANGDDGKRKEITGEEVAAVEAPKVQLESGEFRFKGASSADEDGDDASVVASLSGRGSGQRGRRGSGPRRANEANRQLGGEKKGGVTLSLNKRGYDKAEKKVVMPRVPPGFIGGDVGGERYAEFEESDFESVSAKPLSTFSIDVDTASYANARRYLKRGVRPPAGAVRVEEMINYFDYGYAPPTGPEPFAVHLETADSPFSGGRRLVRIGLKGREIERSQRPVSNLVFLLDVSGSMSAPNKLPLLEKSLEMLLAELSEKDRVAIVVYAGASGLVLPSTPADKKGVIRKALGRLKSGGSTNGGAGIELAYRVAVENFIEGGTNRVILATDGDFNVGTTGRGDLQTLIEAKAKSGVFLSVLGFGMGNLNDQTLETLADKGNGNYAYIDTANEAEKVLVEQLSGTLVTIAKDVKIQVEFNPARVSSWRLIGYANRKLADRDFADDTKDAGEIGAGHTVTALYEVTPAKGAGAGDGVELKYQDRPRLNEAAGSGELLTVKLRYKEPDGDTSELLTFPLEDDRRPLAQASTDFRFATAVAMFGQLLTGSAHSGEVTMRDVRALASRSLGEDEHGYRREFVDLVVRAADARP